MELNNHLRTDTVLDKIFPADEYYFSDYLEISCIAVLLSKSSYDNYIPSLVTKNVTIVGSNYSRVAKRDHGMPKNSFEDIYFIACYPVNPRGTGVLGYVYKKKPIIIKQCECGTETDRHSHWCPIET